MALFMDTHEKVQGLTATAVADAHRLDLEVQKQHGVRYQEPKDGRASCQTSYCTRMSSAVIGPVPSATAER